MQRHVILAVVTALAAVSGWNFARSQGAQSLQSPRGLGALSCGVTPEPPFCAAVRGARAEGWSRRAARRSWRNMAWS